MGSADLRAQVRLSAQEKTGTAQRVPQHAPRSGEGYLDQEGYAWQKTT